MPNIRIAIEGCAHGELDRIYAELKAVEQETGKKVDLLLICGDVQTFRNIADLKTMACPPKYRKLGNFYEYYNGTRTAHVPTVIIGGNHESSSYLWELNHGGWLAENIYYLGKAGCIRFGNLRIAGISGIYKEQHFNFGFFEKPPFNFETMRSIYHVRKYDMNRILLLSKVGEYHKPIDIFLSHDWPLGIEKSGDLEDLLLKKPFFREDIERNSLGSFPGKVIMDNLHPRRWFSAHMHVKFEAKYLNSSNGAKTEFLALDKCLRNRHHLEIIEIEAEELPSQLEYDPEWLAIVKATSDQYPETKEHNLELDFQSADFLRKVLESLNWIMDNVKDFKIPENFSQTAPAQQEGIRWYSDKPFTNPQTVEFCKLLSIENRFTGESSKQIDFLGNPDEIKIDQDLQGFYVASKICDDK